jgi:hypothetical protein
MDIDLKYGRKKISFRLPHKAAIPAYLEPEYSISKTSFLTQLVQYLPADKSRTPGWLCGIG